MDGPAALIALADHLQRGELPPAPIREHITRAVRACLNGTEIERALHLRPAGNEYAIRDAALAEAGTCLGGDKYALAKEVGRFEARTWPRWRHRTAPPSEAGDLDRHLFTAFRAGRKVPTSPKQLGRILDKNPCRSVQSAAR
jgi:hypothetical protein